MTRLLYAAPRGPGPHHGGPPGRPGSAQTQAVALAGPRWGPLCAAPVPHSPRCAALAWLGPVARARAAAAVAAPVRRLRPRFARRGRASLACPPLPRSARVRRCAAPWALAGPVCLRPRPRVAAGSLFGRPCYAWAWALCSAWPRGGPLRARCRGFGPGGSRPGPPAAAPPFFPSGGRGGAARAACRACCALLRPRCLGSAAPLPGALHVPCRWGSPLRPPPAAPAGGSGCPRPEGGFAPALGRASRAPLAGPPARCARPRPAVSGVVDSPDIVNRGLTSRRERAILEVRGPFPPLRGPPQGVRGTARSAAWSVTRRRFFHALCRSDTRSLPA